MTTARYILQGTRNLDGIQVMGDPKTSVVAWTSKIFDIYRLQSAMKDKGWQMSALQFPPGYVLVESFSNYPLNLK